MARDHVEPQRAQCARRRIGGGAGQRDRGAGGAGAALADHGVAAAVPRGTPNLSVPRSAAAPACALTTTLFSPSTMSIICVTGSPVPSVQARSLYLPGASARKRNLPSGLVTT